MNRLEESVAKTLLNQEPFEIQNCSSLVAFEERYRGLRLDEGRGHGAAAFACLRGHACLDPRWQLRLRQFGVALGLNVVYLGLAGMLFSKVLRTAREKGLLVKTSAS